MCREMAVCPVSDCLVDEGDMFFWMWMAGDWILMVWYG